MSKPISILLLLLLFTTNPFLAQEPADAQPGSVKEEPKEKKKKKQSLFKILDYEEVPGVQVQANFDRIRRDRKRRFPIEGHLTFEDVHGSGFTLPIAIETRGKTRFIKCEVPPIRIRMDKKALKEARIKDYPKLKTVLPCELNDDGTDRLFRELLVYRLYEQVTDFAFRTKPVQLDILDSASLNVTLSTYAFFIESDKEFRKRNDFTEVNQYNLQWDDLHPHHRQVFAIFQYMIGNTDWAIRMKHNMRYFQVDTDEPVIPLPYDFDFCGVVDSPIAKPNPDYKQRHIRQRIYLGQPDDQLPVVLEHFKTQRAAILQIVQDFPHLNDDSKQDILEYLNEFFKVLDSKKACRKAFRRRYE